MKSMERFCRVLSKVGTQRQATRVWNWVDHQGNPEPYWDLMMSEIPWAFCGNSPNDFYFVY